MMNIEYIIRKIKEGESVSLEFKESKEALPKDFYETAVSFSNTNGGMILLGIADNGDILGINDNYINQIEDNITSTLNNNKNISPSIYSNTLKVEIESKKILVVQVPASSQVHKYSGRVYFRSSSIDIDITNDTKKIEQLYLNKTTSFSETIIYPHLKMEDLEPNLFLKARNLIRSYRSDHPWLLENDEQMLRDSCLWRKDFKTGEEGLTLAAALIFGKDITIQNILPAYKVEAIRRIENLDRYDDRITLRTNLIDTYLKLKDFINKHLDESFYMESDQRIDLRDKIFREVIGNVVVHREYTNLLSTDLTVYKNSVIITNPNKPLFRGVLDPCKFNPHAKNPNIRKFFTAFGWTDEIGSGVRNTNKYLPLYTNGAKPIFYEDDTFKVEIPLKSITMGKFFSEFCIWLNLDISANEHLKESMLKIPIITEYAQLEFKEIISKLVPSWISKGTQLSALKLPKNKWFKKNNEKKEPSYNENSTQLFQKRAHYYIAILILCAEPMSIKDILEAFSYKNDTIFKNNYIKPLRECGLLKLLDEDKPTSSINKYQLSPDGNFFLSGE